MKQIKISVHSVIDLITNSSTETYIMADKNTIDGIKSIVNGILHATNVDKTFDDLFTIELAVPWRYEDYLDEELDEELCEEKCADFKTCTFDKSDNECKKKHLIYTLDEWEIENDGEYYDRSVIVTAKDDDCVETAKILSNLTGLFDIESRAEY